MLAATRQVESQRGRVTDDETFLDFGRITVKNVSAFTIPEFGIMQVVQGLTEGGRNVVEVSRPFDQTRPSSVWLLNGPFPIEPNGFGTAQSGPEYRVKTEAAYTNGTRLGWQNGSFQAIPGCLFTMIGTDSITTNVAIVIPDSSMLHGVVSVAIAAELGTAGEVQTTGPTTTHKAKTRGAGIAIGEKVFIWPSKGEWIAAKVC